MILPVIRPFYQPPGVSSSFSIHGFRTKDSITPMSLMPPTFGTTLQEGDFLDMLGWLLTK